MDPRRSTMISCPALVGGLAAGLFLLAPGPTLAAGGGPAGPPRPSSAKTLGKPQAGLLALLRSSSGVYLATTTVTSGPLEVAEARKGLRAALDPIKACHAKLQPAVRGRLELRLLVGAAGRLRRLRRAASTLKPRPNAVLRACIDRSLRAARFAAPRPKKRPTRLRVTLNFRPPAGAPGTLSGSGTLGGLIGSPVGAPGRGGALDRQAIRQLVRKNVRQVQRCYQRLLVKQPGASGKVIVRFVVGASGKVLSTTVRSSTVGAKGGSELESCLTGEIRSWRFPAPKGGTVVISYPFVFRTTP